MGSAAKRVDATFWVDGSTVRAMALSESAMLKASEAGVIEFPPLREDTIAMPQSKPISLVEILERFERQICYSTIVLTALMLAVISVSATSAGITVRDARIRIDNLRTSTSLLQHQLEEAKKTPPPGFTDNSEIIIPLDPDSVTYVPLPKAR